ncbi:MAG TPA: hypothetical protein VFG69_09040 [Nannocystaceae bacterium]|nr:hypothetical protein [Nannocystaceae bacterium]
MTAARSSWAGRVGAAWGVLGVLALLGQAFARLGPRALEAWTMGLSPSQLVVLAAWTGFMIYSEGVRGFHRRFSPRVVARAMWLREHPRPLFVAIAPFFCMSLVHASKRGLVVARVLVFAIVLLVAVVSQMPQPWRGIVDAGVVAGLGIGAASILWFAARALAGTRPPIAPDLPATDDAVAGTRVE